MQTYEIDDDVIEILDDDVDDNGTSYFPVKMELEPLEATSFVEVEMEQSAGAATTSMTTNYLNEAPSPSKLDVGDLEMLIFGDSDSTFENLDEIIV